MEIELKDTKRAVRRSKSFAKYNARIADYKASGQLYDWSAGWVRFLAKNRFGYKTDREMGSSRNDNLRLTDHPKTHKVNHRKAIDEALALA